MTFPSRTLTLVATLALFASACSTASGTGGGVVDASGSDGSAGGADTGSGSTTGDNTRNKASVTAKDDAGATTQVDNDKPAAKGDADQKILGAAGSGPVLSLFVSDAKGNVIFVSIDTKKHPLPATGIPVGEPNSDAWVTYTSGGAVLNSKDTGTIDVDTCPKKDGVAVVGKLNGVVVLNEAPIGPKSVTLTGTFNLVYFGGAGALECKPEGGSSSGGSSSGGGTVDTGPFKKPAASSCDANPCDGGTNSKRNCCPWVPCLSSCWNDCVTKAQTCFQSCGFDFECPQKCTAEVFVCQAKCPVTCEVGAACSDAIGKLNKCEETHANACTNEDSEKQDACVFDKCCAEVKAAF